MKMEGSHGHGSERRRPGSGSVPAVVRSRPAWASDSRGGDTTAIHFRLNGRAVSTDADAASPLLYVLRDEFQLNGPKFGCGLGECGACTVLVNDVAVRSCSVPVVYAQGNAVTTLEGLGTIDHPSVVQQAFIDEQAAQCGYCINGMIMQATSFLKQNPHPTRAEIITAMDNNMCRCGTHLRILAAIENAAAKGGV